MYFPSLWARYQQMEETPDWVYSSMNRTMPHPHLGMSHHISLCMVPDDKCIRKNVGSARKTVKTWPGSAQLGFQDWKPRPVQGNLGRGVKAATLSWDLLYWAGSEQSNQQPAKLKSILEMTRHEGHRDLRINKKQKLISKKKKKIPPVHPSIHPSQGRKATWS